MQHRSERQRSKKSGRDHPKRYELNDDDWNAAFCITTTSCLMLLAPLAFVVVKTICHGRHPADICHTGDDAMRAPTTAFAFPFLRGMLSGMAILTPVVVVVMLHLFKPHIRNRMGAKFWCMHASLAGFVICCVLVIFLSHTDHFIPIPQHTTQQVVPAPAPGTAPSQLAHVVNFQVPPGLVAAKHWRNHLNESLQRNLNLGAGKSYFRCFCCSCRQGDLW